MDENNNNKESFFQKVKTDKKYKAKVELLGYVVLIVLIIIYLNISNIGNNYNYNNVTDNTSSKEETKKETNLLDDLDDNYNYSIDVYQETKQSNDTNATNIEINYNGKSYKDNLIINKVINGNSTTYYKVEDEYYTKENEEYNLTDEDIIYDILDKKYLEYNNVKKYIKKASLDHITNYSSGKNEYVYNLKVSDIIQSYKESDLVEIDITIENDIITMNIDYTNLLKVTDETITKCTVTYTYKDINKVEEFNIINPTSTETATNEED